MENLNWQKWFEQWEVMQNCYVPHRPYRFDLMVRLADLPREGEAQILDLGCGPGSLAFRALRWYPNAHAVAVDSDPVLLAMGQAVAEEALDRIRFVQADIQQADWWETYEEAFDLVLSATALHRLSAEDLEQLYEHIYRALRPGGWFMSSGYMTSSDPGTRACLQEMLHVNQQSALHVTGAYDWDGFWQGLGRDLEQTELLQYHRPRQGPESGLLKHDHVSALKACGFERVEFHWQDLGEAVASARKLSGTNKG